MLAYVLALLASLAPHFTDRDEPTLERAHRLEQLAEDITIAARGDREIAKALVVYAKSETNLARYVAEGRCMDGPPGSQCDPGPHGPRARTLFQVWRGSCPKAWEAPRGSREAQREGAVCVAAMLRAGRARCGTVEGMFAATYGLPICSSPGSERRAAEFRRMR